MMRRRGGKVVQYDPYVGTQWDLGHGVGSNPYRRRYYGGMGRRVHPALIMLLLIVIIGFLIRYFIF